MKIKFLFSLLLILYPILGIADEAFVWPDAERRYDQVTVVVSHNAPFSKADDYIYYNQDFNLMDQYKKGARGFELDIERRCWNEFGPFGGEKCNISLCHDSCEVNKFLQPRVGGLLTMTGDPNSFKDYALKTIKQILTENKDEILTITLENRVKSFDELDKDFENAGLADMILKPADWDPNEKKGWPTLKWMREKNKRLVIFSDTTSAVNLLKGTKWKSSRYAYYQWATVVQNQWGGAKDINVARKERGQSEKNNLGFVRYLYELDWFPAEGRSAAGVTDLITSAASIFKEKTPFAGDMNQVNGPELEAGLKAIVEQGLTSGRAKGRYPNFIKIDFVGQGYATKVANDINKMANDSAKREKMYAPIP